MRSLNVGGSSWSSPDASESSNSGSLNLALFGGLRGVSESSEVSGEARAMCRFERLFEPQSGFSSSSKTGCSALRFGVDCLFARALTPEAETLPRACLDGSLVRPVLDAGLGAKKRPNDLGVMVGFPLCLEIPLLCTGHGELEGSSSARGGSSTAREHGEDIGVGRSPAAMTAANTRSDPVTHSGLKVKSGQVGK
jgi:hypothetical protein